MNGTHTQEVLPPVEKPLCLQCKKCVNRDLYTWNETYKRDVRKCVKRDVRKCVKRDVRKCVKRDLYIHGMRVAKESLAQVCQTYIH
jgi:hypothetical protein